jgi:hypothetical protein
MVADTYHVYKGCYDIFESFYFVIMTIKRDKPYEIKQGDDGLFVPAGSEPNNSPNVQLRMSMSLYEALKKASDGKFAPWIREAIAEKLQRENSA